MEAGQHVGHRVALRKAGETKADTVGNRCVPTALPVPPTH